MNKLEQAITTVEIAEMMEVRHSDVLMKLEGNGKVKGIIPVLAERNFPLSDYFKESVYKDSSGKANKCYLVTKIGCDFLANKFTGEKGIIFTAKYVKRFYDMETSIAIAENRRPLTAREIMREQLTMIDEVSERVDKLENTMVIDYGQQRVLEKLVAGVVITALGGKESSAYHDFGKKVFSECNRDIKDYFLVNSRNNIPRIKFDDACKYIKMWQPCTNTKMLIADYNAQMCIS